MLQGVSRITGGSGGGGGTIGGSIAANQIGYGSGVNTLTSDSSATRDATTKLTNIFAPIVSSGATAGFTIGTNIFGFPINGSALVNTATDGYSGVFTGDGTGAGGSDAFSAIVSHLNSGGDSSISVDASNGIKLQSSFGINFYNAYSFPTSDGTNGQALTTNGSGQLSFTTIGATPGGADTQVQYNDMGAFAGDGNFTWDYTNKNFTVGLSGGTQLTINNTGNNITVQSPAFEFTDGSGNYAIEANAGASSSSVVLGDASATGNGNNFTVDDGGQNIIGQLGLLGDFRIQQNGHPFLNINPGNNLFQMGDIGATANSGMVVIVDNSTMANIAWGATTGNGTFANLNDPGEMMTLTASDSHARFNLNSSNISPGLLATWQYGITDTIFQVDGANRGIAVGDVSLGHNQTVFRLDDASSHITFQLPSTGVFNIQDPSLNPVFQAVTGVGTSAVSIGDVNRVDTKTVLNIGRNIIAAYVSGAFEVNSASDDSIWLNVDPGDRVTLGDYSNAYNSTQLIVDDSSQIFNFKGFGSVPADRIASFDNANRIARIGDVDADFSGTLMTVDDTNQLIQINGVHVRFPGLQNFANNAAAIGGGLASGDAYLVTDAVTGSYQIQVVI